MKPHGRRPAPEGRRERSGGAPGPTSGARPGKPGGKFGGKSAAGPRPERGARPGKPGGKPSSSPRPERGSRPGKPGRGERSERPERGARPERPRSAKPHPAGPPPHTGKRRPEGYNPRRQKVDKGHIWVPGPNARTIRSEAGQDLAHYLVSQTGGKISVRKAREHLENSCCRINGRIETFGSYELVIGDVVEFLLPEEDTEHRFDPERILHNDRGVLVYDKPPHLAVTPQDGPKSWSLLDILRHAHPDQPLFPVHRLDADTSGIVIFAKDPTTAQRLEAMFRDHAVEKTYHAIVRGHIREEGLHKSYLVKVASHKGFEKWRSGHGPDAREAITSWKVEERLGKYGSLVKVQPKTGRYHQIRIHFSELGHSLYGDKLYGDRLDPVHVHRHLLHASEVHLPNPSSGPALRIKCRLPRDFTTAMEKIRKI
jgi:23S rRNA pseudouridine955/2504/2580 synthase/23S rRNA pseudouridine1911/1915/1917 synthase